MNTNKLRELIPDENTGALISSQENRRYFTEFPSSDGYLLITKKETVFFTDSRYIEAARLQCVDCDRILLYEGLKKSIQPIIQELDIKKLMLEASRVTLSECEKIRTALSVSLVTDGTLDTLIEEKRAVKGQRELDLIMKAQRISEKAFEHICGFIKDGMTEREIGLELDYFMLKNGAEALSFETIAVCGEKTSMPHGVPGENRVKRGDFITMDFGAVCEGYHSDMTRTVAVGYVTEEMKKVYDTVLSAQTAAFTEMRDGAECVQVDKKGRDVIEKAGYGKCFGHGLGHGVGIEIHEEPSLSPRGRGVLKKGNIVTNEPGIYIEGKFGVRIEDMALITEDGYIDLTHAPKELIILG